MHTYYPPLLHGYYRNHILQGKIESLVAHEITKKLKSQNIFIGNIMFVNSELRYKTILIKISLAIAFA